MKPIWKLLALGATVIFLMQSCVTVRPHRHRHQHKHCLVVAQWITDMTLFNLPSAECLVASGLYHPKRNYRLWYSISGEVVTYQDGLYINE